MSNLESARAAIEAEIAHAREGFAFYQSRIETLQKMLSQLASVDGAGPAPKRRGRKPGSVNKVKKVVKAGRGRRAGKADSGQNDLPFTGGNYWVNLVTSEPQSVSEILQAAVGKLDFTPSDEQVKKLAGRMTFALNALVKTRQIQDSGSGRERRFFKK